MTTDFLQPFSCVSGSRSPKIVIVGECWGENEDREKKPFVGEAGKELFRMLTDAWPDLRPDLAQWIKKCMSGTSLWAKEREPWLEAAGVMLTNSFNLRPPENKFDAYFCSDKKIVGADYALPPLRTGKYIRSEFFTHTERLRLEIESVRPNLVICAGNVACWSILRATNIGSIRGNITHGMLLPVKVLPTFHPSSILHEWAQRTIVLADLRKARREAEFPDIRRPERRIIVFPTWAEINTWIARNRHAPIISVDTETSNGQITDIGFSTTPKEALVITFVYPRGHPQAAQSVFESIDDELLAWNCVEEILNFDGEKLFQNGLYDLQYLLRMWLRPKNCRQDTMLRHHSIFPEMKKGLGFLGSVYTNESSWKLMRKHKEELKKDE